MIELEPVEGGRLAGAVQAQHDDVQRRVRRGQRQILEQRATIRLAHVGSHIVHKSGVHTNDARLPYTVVVVQRVSLVSRWDCPTQKHAHTECGRRFARSVFSGDCPFSQGLEARFEFRFACVAATLRQQAISLGARIT